jgi:hypothetical protein
MSCVSPCRTDLDTRFLLRCQATRKVDRRGSRDPTEVNRATAKQATALQRSQHSDAFSSVLYGASGNNDKPDRAGSWLAPRLPEAYAMNGDTMAPGAADSGSHVADASTHGSSLSCCCGCHGSGGAASSGVSGCRGSSPHPSCMRRVTTPLSRACSPMEWGSMTPYPTLNELVLKLLQTRTVGTIVTVDIGIRG